MNQANQTRSTPKVVHLHGYAWRAQRDKKNNGYAPCGALVSSSDMNAPLESSHDELDKVTCERCQEQIATLGRAYSKARRLKLIEW